jgi:hypothetical protein
MEKFIEPTFSGKFGFLPIYFGILKDNTKPVLIVQYQWQNITSEINNFSNI